MTVPSDLSARLLYSPADTAVTLVRPDGTLAWPLTLLPQATTVPERVGPLAVAVDDTAAVAGSNIRSPAIVTVNRRRKPSTLLIDRNIDHNPYELCLDVAHSMRSRGTLRRTRGGGPSLRLRLRA